MCFLTIKGVIIMIGNIIKQARQKQNLSQRELAKLTGLTQAGISKLELGGCDPSAKTMIKLTEVLGLKDKIFPSEIIEDEIDMDLEKRVERRVETRLEARLEARLESRLKEDITHDLLNDLETEVESRLKEDITHDLLNDLKTEVENKLKNELESKLKEDITNDLFNEFDKRLRIEFDKRFDPILQMISKMLSYNNNLTCETCNAKQ